MKFFPNSKKAKVSVVRIVNCYKIFPLSQFKIINFEYLFKIHRLGISLETFLQRVTMEKKITESEEFLVPGDPFTIFVNEYQNYYLF